MTRFVVVALAAALGFSGPVASAEAPAARQLFDFDWRFHLGDVENGQAPSFDDAAWTPVDLPHDFMIEGPGLSGVEGPFDQRSPGGSGNGYLNGGVGWYRKTFTVPPSAAAQRVLLEFEGIYMNSEVWVNGAKAGGRPYGYSTFQLDVTPQIKVGAPNVVAVRVNVQQPSSRWYSGAGIYRHVWMTLANPVRLAAWGTVVTTPMIEAAGAVLNVKSSIVNDSTAAAATDVDVVVLDRAKKEVARSRTQVTARAGEAAPVETTVTVPRPRRWSIADPYLYSVELRLRINNREVDVNRIATGFRTIAFTPDGGFSLNGVKVPLQGVCLHHDLGPLGAAAFDRGIERQLEIMKRLGVNAIRTSHNPPAPALLDLADRMGFVVMDEAFDEWRQNKTRFGYGRFFDAWSERDIRDMVRRDRNHPSVVMWSIGNEIPEQRNAQTGEPMATRLAGFVRAEDPTRPITAAMNNPTQALATGFAKPLDLFGVNYNLGVYDRVRGTKTFASETSSNYSSRDEYNLEIIGSSDQRAIGSSDQRVIGSSDQRGAGSSDVRIVNQRNNHATSYDLDFPSWGNTAERQFQAMAAAPWMAGEFVWTGLDYIGEPTPFNWPNRSSSFGIVDIAGFPKDRFYLYQSKWRPEPMVHLLPHWNWPDDFKGKAIPVWAYTNGESVELFLNGKSLGSRDWTGVKETHLAWNVPYEPGTLRAVAKRGGKIVAEDTVETTGPPARLELVADRAAIRADGQDLSFITVRVVDAKGRLCRADGNFPVQFELSGAAGAIAGVDNGDPTNHEPFKGPDATHASHLTFHGLEIVVLRAPRAAGTMTLTARAEGLAAATVRIAAR